MRWCNIVAGVIALGLSSFIASQGHAGAYTTGNITVQDLPLSLDFTFNTDDGAILVHERTFVYPGFYSILSDVNADGHTEFNFLTDYFDETSFEFLTDTEGD